MDRKENIKLVRGGRRRKEEEEGGEEGIIKHAMFISPTEPLLITTDQTKWKEKAFCRRKVRCIAKVIRAGGIRFIWYYLWYKVPESCRHTVQHHPIWGSYRSITHAMNFLRLSGTHFHPRDFLA